MADPTQHKPVDGVRLGQKGYGARRQSCHEGGGADANTLLAGRRSRTERQELKVAINRCVSLVLSNHMRPPACVKLKRA